MPIPLLMPALSPTMTEGTLSKWIKKEGEAIKSGDVLAEIETDKATMEFEAVDEGVLGKILVAPGTAGVKVNEPIAVILEEGEDASVLKSYTPSAAKPAEKPVEESKPAPDRTEPAGAAVREGPPKGDRVFASPLARRLAAQEGLDLSAIAGSGPHGRIVKRDIEEAKKAPRPAAKPAADQPPAARGPATPAPQQVQAPHTALPNNNIRKVIARRLLESKTTIPHYYLTIDCEVDELLKIRGQLNARAPEGDGAYKISVNDFVVRAVALTLRKVPRANATWTEEAILEYEDVDISVAVATENGLLTPVVRRADTKGLATISNEIKALAAKARAGKLTPEEYQGGGFTISNLGMYGIKDFAAIINPPQSGILAVGVAEQRPVVKEGALAIATVMSCTLSADHRSLDGAVGAEFMAALKKVIEDPLSMLL